MLSAMRSAASRTDSRDRWAYRAVVSTWAWPSSFPIMGRLSPSARVAAAAKSEEWEELKEIGKGGKVDRLAVDPEGRLVIVELKYASASAYNYSPRRLSTFRLTKMSTVVR